VVRLDPENQISLNDSFLETLNWFRFSRSGAMIAVQPSEQRHRPRWRRIDLHVGVCGMATRVGASVACNYGNTSTDKRRSPVEEQPANQRVATN
jgi:hypothetical protein